MEANVKPVFIPMLYLRHEDGVAAIAFYKEAFGAVEFRTIGNDDETVHVSELEIGGTMFRFHEDKVSAGHVSPLNRAGVTASFSLRVADPDALMARAIAAGAKLVSPMQDYDYGYRQGDLLDPFGHLWTLEKVI